MSSVAARGEEIYEHLAARLGQRFTMAELCAALNLQPGAKTQAAIRAARDMATAAGLHFPPAVPQNGFTYAVTNLPGDALDPTLHMSRIEAGVRARADVGYEFMRRNLRQVPAELRPIARAALDVREATQTALAQTQRAMDDMVVELVKLRREQRAEAEREARAAGNGA
jgi:hypothetical protein